MAVHPAHMRPPMPTMACSHAAPATSSAASTASEPPHRLVQFHNHALRDPATPHAVPAIPQAAVGHFTMSAHVFALPHQSPSEHSLLIRHLLISLMSQMKVRMNSLHLFTSSSQSLGSALV